MTLIKMALIFHGRRCDMYDIPNRAFPLWFVRWLPEWDDWSRGFTTWKKNIFWVSPHGLTHGLMDGKIFFLGVKKNMGLSETHEPKKICESFMIHDSFPHEAGHVSRMFEVSPIFCQYQPGDLPYTSNLCGLLNENSSLLIYYSTSFI